MEEQRTHKLRFHKEERLRLKNLVEPLFREGEGYYDFPLRLVWRIVDRKNLENTFRNGIPEGISPLQMMVTVPKKKRRHAVDRVKMRRRIREAYRLNRLSLKELITKYNSDGTLSLGFIYISQNNEDYSLVERKMQRLLQKMEKRIIDYFNADKTPLNEQ